MSFYQFVMVACFIFDLLMVSGMTSSAVIRRKRSDDGGPLEAVVENLSQQVNVLNAQLTQQVNSLNAEIAVIKSKTGKSP